MQKYWIVPFVAVVGACSSSSSSLGIGGDDTVDPGNDGGAALTDSGGGGGTVTDSGGGGTVTDSGTTVDAGVDAGNIPSCAGLAYCDDFESYSGAITNGMTLGPWKASVGGAVVATVDTTKAYSGTKSLHITIASGDTGAHATLNQMKAAGLVTGNNMYGRAMVYYSNAGGADVPTKVHSWVFQSTGKSTKTGNDVSMNVANNGSNYFLNYHPGTPSTEYSASGGKPTAGKWICMQWQFDGSGKPPADDGKINIDGMNVVDAKAKTPNWDFATPWDSFDFGFTHYQTTGNKIDVYLDDVAVDGKPVACPP